MSPSKDSAAWLQPVIGIWQRVFISFKAPGNLISDFLSDSKQFKMGEPNKTCPWVQMSVGDGWPAHLWGWTGFSSVSLKLEAPPGPVILGWQCLGSVVAHIGETGRQGQGEPRSPMEESVRQGSGLGQKPLHRGPVGSGGAHSSETPPAAALCLAVQNRSPPWGCRCHMSSPRLQGGRSCSLRRGVLPFP